MSAFKANVVTKAHGGLNAVQDIGQNIVKKNRFLIDTNTRIYLNNIPSACRSSINIRSTNNRIHNSSSSQLNNSGQTQAYVKHTLLLPAKIMTPATASLSSSLTASTLTKSSSSSLASASSSSSWLLSPLMRSLSCSLSTSVAVALLLIACILSGHVAVGVTTGAVRPGTGNPSARLPRTSASQLNSGNTTGNSNAYKLAAKSLNTTNQRNGNLRTRWV